MELINSRLRLGPEPFVIIRSINTGIFPFSGHYCVHEELEQLITEGSNYLNRYRQSVTFNVRWPERGIQ